MLCARKEQLASILSSMADGVITLNQEGEVVVINPPAEHFLQVWQEEKRLSKNYLLNLWNYSISL